jgi:hypothetical protein
VTTSTKLGWLLIVATLALVVGGAVALVPHLPAGWSPVMFGLGVLLAVAMTLWIVLPVSQSFRRVAWLPLAIASMATCNAVGFALPIPSFWSGPLFALSMAIAWAVATYVVAPAPGAPPVWERLDRFSAGWTRYGFWTRFAPALLLLGLVVYVVVMRHI